MAGNVRIPLGIDSFSKLREDHYYYYEKMLDVVRSLLGEATKTNPHLKFCVVTGCLLISRKASLRDSIIL